MFPPFSQRDIQICDNTLMSGIRLELTLQLEIYFSDHINRMLEKIIFTFSQLNLIFQLL